MQNAFAPVSGLRPLDSTLGARFFDCVAKAQQIEGLKLPQAATVN
jgi:hypothetical protein